MIVFGPRGAIFVEPVDATGTHADAFECPLEPMAKSWTLAGVPTKHDYKNKIIIFG